MTEIDWPFTPFNYLHEDFFTQDPHYFSLSYLLNLEKSHPLLIEYYLHGIMFPARQPQLLKQAKLNHAPLEIILILEKIDPQGIYYCPIDVSKGIARIFQEKAEFFVTKK